MRTFRLFPQPQHYCSLSDYGAILGVTERLRPARVIEFGPGWSTLALVEGGAQAIDCLEDSEHWSQIWSGRLWPYGIAKMIPYEWADPLSTPRDGRHYDMAVIDGPAETLKREAVIEYCCKRCDAVLVALEEHNTEPMLRPICEHMAARHGMGIETWTTGPLAGAWALLTC